MDQDDVLFRNSKWLENFKEMKQAAIDPLYEGCPKHLTVLHLNLQMLMLKARHGWSDMSFNDLSPMHISQRAIIGFDIPDTDPRLVKLKEMERGLARNLMQV